MVMTTDSGNKMKCSICGEVIKNRESCGAVDDGDNICHTDCWRDKLAYEDAKDIKWIHEIKSELSEKGLTNWEIAMKERRERHEMVKRWANFKDLPNNKYGGRRVA